MPLRDEESRSLNPSIVPEGGGWGAGIWGGREGEGGWRGEEEEGEREREGVGGGKRDMSESFMQTARPVCETGKPYTCM
jgi:hypothetical protein